MEILLGIADEVARMENNLSRMDPGTPGFKQLDKGVGRMKEYLRMAGLEMEDMLGKPYVEGMTVVASFVPDGDVPPGQFIITRVDQPQISYEGQLFQLDLYPFWQDQAVAKIELNEADAQVKLPPELELIREVTGEREFKDYALAVSYGDSEI